MMVSSPPPRGQLVLQKRFYKNGSPKTVPPKIAIRPGRPRYLVAFAGRGYYLSHFTSGSLIDPMRSKPWKCPMTTKEKTKGICAKFHVEWFRKSACLALIDDASGGVEVCVVASSLYCGINETGADVSCCHHQQLMVSANEHHSRWCFVCMKKCLSWSN